MGAQTCQGQRRIGTRGHDKMQVWRQMMEQKRKTLVNFNFRNKVIIL